ncbi:MAG: hypothetical protein JST16_01050 [Bdellovibrionales bacterium]|nr:hypothetical protein [Bdellovibrionales bacterium]
MRQHDLALQQAINDVAAIVGEALVRLLFPALSPHSVDFAETESPDGTAG